MQASVSEAFGSVRCRAKWSRENERWMWWRTAGTGHTTILHRNTVSHPLSCHDAGHKIGGGYTSRTHIHGFMSTKAASGAWRVKMQWCPVLGQSCLFCLLNGATAVSHRRLPTRSFSKSNWGKKWEHKISKAHKSAEEISAGRRKETLKQSIGKQYSQDIETTNRIFCTVYFCAKKNHPLPYHPDLVPVDLQEQNGLDMGRVLHSNTVAVDIATHIASEMPNECVTLSVTRKHILQ